MALLLYAVIADRHQEESRERPETRACPTTEYDPHVFPVAASRRDRRVDARKDDEHAPEEPGYGHGV